jgi:hypothetical protein
MPPHYEALLEWAQSWNSDDDFDLGGENVNPNAHVQVPQVGNLGLFVNVGDQRAFALDEDDLNVGVSATILLRLSPMKMLSTRLQWMLPSL